MKIMTLNAHSHGVDFPESLFNKNLDVLAEYIAKYQVDVIALQEACQTHQKNVVHKEELHGYVPANKETVIREDNYVLHLIKRLNQKGLEYSWTWESIKIGYDVFDEGLAIVSKLPIDSVEEYYLSKIKDYKNWKTRKAVAAKISSGAESAWYVSTHMGWWGDEEEDFASHMDKLQKELSGKEGNIYLMGDFNSPSSQRDAGYDYVSQYKWLDTWKLAGHDKHEVTVPGKIDGWSDEAKDGLCIDYIWANYQADVLSSKIVFSGKEEPVISDHFGILAEISEK